VKNEDCQVLFENLKNNQHLIEMNLKSFSWIVNSLGNLISFVGCQSLSEFLMSNQKLQILSLSGIFGFH
jgi:hypothetical protein